MGPLTTRHITAPYSFFSQKFTPSEALISLISKSWRIPLSASKNWEDSVAEIAGEVRAIRGGWEQLTKAHSESNHRFSALEKKLDSVQTVLHTLSQAVAQIEGNYSSDGSQLKEVAGTSTIPDISWDWFSNWPQFKRRLSDALLDMLS